jgi:hypothetical protein
MLSWKFWRNTLLFNFDRISIVANRYVASRNRKVLKRYANKVMASINELSFFTTTTALSPA